MGDWKMRLLVLSVIISMAAALPATMTKEELEAHFGAHNINWDKNVRTQYCDQCLEITIESTGGALEHQFNRLGRYTVHGSLWENMVPLYKSDNNQYLTPDPNSNPVIYYLKWVVSENVGGFNAGIQNSHYTDGITCPYEIPDQWEYEYQREWFIDPTLKVKCTKHKP